MPALEPSPGPAPQAQAPPEIELRPAKINDRFIAYVIDIAPFAAAHLATLIVMILKLQSWPNTDQSVNRSGLFWFSLYLLYQFIGHASGGTVGKRLMGIAVVRKDGRPLGIFRCLVRSLGYVLSTPFFNFGFIVALFHPESRALHDVLAGSLVVEPRPKNPAEAGVLFIGAMGVIIAMFGGTIYGYMSMPTKGDLLAIEKARDGLQVMAQIEEAYKGANGSYTSSLGDLATASGDVEQFRSAMSELFDPHLFQVQAGTKRYRISAAAKDRKKTRVAIEGPPATVVR